MANIKRGNTQAAGHIPSEEVRKQWSMKRVGRKWWNNGINETQSRECPGDGWVRGRLPGAFVGRKRDSGGRYK